MRNIVISFVTALVLANSAFAQHSKLKTFKGEGTCDWRRLESNMTIDKLTQECIVAAQLDALEKTFGKVIMQGNSTFIKNENTGAATETKSVFNFIADSYVAGEWIKNVEPPKIEHREENGAIWYKASVKGEMREKKSVEVTFDAKALSCEDKTCETSQFKNNQNFYLYFKAPKAGFLQVYLDSPDDGITNRILPYSGMTASGGVQVKADEEYIFFSKKNEKIVQPGQVDELKFDLTQENTAESNKLFVLFSPETPFDKPLLNTAASTESQKKIVNSKFTIPPFLASTEFQNWMAKLRSNNNEIQLTTTIIDIKP